MANKSDNTGRVEKGLQPVTRIVQPSQGEQAGLQPVVRPNPTSSGVGSGGQGGESGGSDQGKS